MTDHGLQRREVERLRAALEHFANDLNWRTQPGGLWQPAECIWDPIRPPFDRTPWMIAADALRDPLPIVCEKCGSDKWEHHPDGALCAGCRQVYLTGWITR